MSAVAFSPVVAYAEMQPLCPGACDPEGLSSGYMRATA